MRDCRFLECSMIFVPPAQYFEIRLGVALTWVIVSRGDELEDHF